MNRGAVAYRVSYCICLSITNSFLFYDVQIYMYKTRYATLNLIIADGEEHDLPLRRRGE